MSRVFFQRIFAPGGRLAVAGSRANDISRKNAHRASSHRELVVASFYRLIGTKEQPLLLYSTTSLHNSLHNSKIALKMALSTVFITALLSCATTRVFSQGEPDYPSCIGLDLATQFWFSGDVTSLESCQEACSTLFMDATGETIYDAGELANGTMVDFCECGSAGRLCQDAASIVETTTSPTAAPTTAAPTASPTSAPSIASGEGQESLPTASPTPAPSIASATEGQESPPTAPPPTMAPPTSSSVMTVLDCVMIGVGVMTLWTLMVL
jgi:hypothetical protein